MKSARRSSWRPSHERRRAVAPATALRVVLAACVALAACVVGAVRVVHAVCTARAACAVRAARVALVVLMVWASGASAQTGGGPGPGEETPSSEGALFLLLPTGAQGVATGRAMTATPTQEAAFWNPAGLARMGRARFLLSRGEHLAGEATALSLLLVRESVGTFGASYQLLDVGTQDLTDSDGVVLGSISVRSHLGILSFATAVTSRLDTGINFKLVQFRIDCRGQCIEPGIVASTYAVDLGVQATPFLRLPLRTGAMIAHLGPRLQVVNAEQADPLPTRIRLAAAYEVLGHFLPDAGLDLWVTVELEDRWREPGSPSTYFGGELASGSEDMVFVRAGYVLGRIDQPDGAAVGMGLRYERLELAVAKSLARPGLSGEGEPVHVTVGVTF